MLIAMLSHISHWAGSDCTTYTANTSASLNRLAFGFAVALLQAELLRLLWSLAIAKYGASIEVGYSTSC